MKNHFSRFIVRLIPYIPHVWKERLQRRRHNGRRSTRLEEISLWFLLEALGITLIFSLILGLAFFGRETSSQLSLTVDSPVSAYAPATVRVHAPPSPDGQPYVVALTVPPGIRVESTDGVPHDYAREPHPHVTVNGAKKSEVVVELMVTIPVDGIAYLTATSPFDEASLVLTPRDGPLVVRTIDDQWVWENASPFPFPVVSVYRDNEYVNTYSFPPFGKINFTPRSGEWTFYADESSAGPRIGRILMRGVERIQSVRMIEDEKNLFALIALSPESNPRDHTFSVNDDQYTCDTLSSDSCELKIPIATKLSHSLVSIRRQGIQIQMRNEQSTETHLLTIYPSPLPQKNFTASWWWTAPDGEQWGRGKWPPEPGFVTEAYLAWEIQSLTGYDGQWTVHARLASPWEWGDLPLRSTADTVVSYDSVRRIITWSGNSIATGSGYGSAGPLALIPVRITPDTPLPALVAVIEIVSEEDKNFKPFFVNARIPARE